MSRNPKNRKVILIANDQPPDGDARLNLKMANAVARAERQASLYKDMALGAMQREINENIRGMLLYLDGRYMDLLDLMNFVKNGRKSAALTAGSTDRFYTLANTVTLNGIYLYQFLSRAGYEPWIVQNYSLADFSELLHEEPLAVCISSNFIFMDDIRAMASRVKELQPRVPVIVGGMLVKKFLDAGEGISEPARRQISTFHGKVDAFVIEAQGEQSLLLLLGALESGDDPAVVPNLALYDEKGRLHFTPREPENLRMDDTAIQWDRIPRNLLRKTLPLNSSRGCYYRCRFCTYHWLFPEVRYKSLDVLREELRSIRSLGFVRHIRFTDDNFTANKSRLRAVLEMMIREGFEFTWSSFARAGALSPELVRLMKASGCEFVDMGIESGSQVILDNMDKRLKREQTLEAVRMLNDSGIYGRGSFIVGYPGETEETFAETVDLINSSGLPYYHPWLFYYSRNSLIHEDREKYGLKGLGPAWRHDTMDAAEASRLMRRMIRLIDHGYTDGQTYVEEIYKLLRGEGYEPAQILALFRLKRELQLALEDNRGIEGILSEMEAIVR